jgi:hypothetical protein
MTTPDRRELLAAVDLGQLLEEVTGVPARGAAYPCPNPNHDQTGRTPPVSLGVSNDYQLFNCHGCGAGGTAIDALMLVRGFDAAGALAELRTRAGHTEAPPVPKPKRNPQPLPSEQRIAELAQRLVDDRRLVERVGERRGWSRDALASLGVGVDGDRLTFPIRDGAGALVNVCKYSPRPSDGERKMISLAGRPRDLYPAPESIEGDVVWLVEGEPDSVAATSIGLPAVGLPGVEFAKRLDVERFRRFSRVHIVLDCDQPGRDAATQIASALAKAGVESRVVDIEPNRDDGFDLGDLVSDAAQDGPDGLVSARRLLEQMVATAEPAATADATGGVQRTSAATGWPKPLDRAAYHGLAGQIVRAIEPHTEADPAAVLASFLVAYGNAVGRGPGFSLGATFHATNLYVLLVGPTSSGRKGTAGDEVRRVFKMAEPEWASNRIVDGLSSGEGLVWQVRDPITKYRKARKEELGDADGMVEEIEDHGEPDKRLLVIEGEFARPLKNMAREGNTLSPTLRALWDRGDARS